MDVIDPIKAAAQALRQGKIIAYPTESVFGFGCDPFNHDAITSLLQLKNRPFYKGFILVAADWEQVESLTQQISPMLLWQIQNTWPGPITWVFPASHEVPEWIRGNNENVALRISDHPIIQEICKVYGGPIVSTSANVSGEIPTANYNTTKMAYGDKVAYIVPGETGGLSKPTKICDAITGDILRDA
ncbi:MAG: threonylcarbamoyl-AMP synthase [Gammaproteobacteria bacterium]|nr:threonylcarbamoyl-AMP synthase [Gammaproteobacteria bacterium]MCH9744445.1 threonylcarbamoyl-AMP synthase [Gammaproteobacteria bacterium]